eukprot:Skav222811  [mRNA]  locus=scaffold1444:80284:84777:+ [translate_table: standard]
MSGARCLSHFFFRRGAADLAKEWQFEDVDLVSAGYGNLSVLRWLPTFDAQVDPLYSCFLPGATELLQALRALLDALAPDGRVARCRTPNGQALGPKRRSASEAQGPTTAWTVKSRGEVASWSRAPLLVEISAAGSDRIGQCTRPVIWGPQLAETSVGSVPAVRKRVDSYGFLWIPICEMGWYVAGAFNITNGTWDAEELARMESGIVANAQEPQASAGLQGLIAGDLRHGAGG